MANLKPRFILDDFSVFDETLFRREDNLLNVFRSTVKDDEVDGLSEDLFQPTQPSSHSKTQHFLFEYSAERTKFQKNAVYLDFKEDGSHQNFTDPCSPMKITCTPLGNSDPKDMPLQSEAKTCPTTLTTETHNCLMNSNYLCKSTSSSVEKSYMSSKVNRKSYKLFSRRKDVIIKTLLRKCKKYFTKHFNSSTSYLKTEKRKFGSRVYKATLETYITKVLQIPITEDLLIFLGVFLYPKDLEDNMDLFVSPNYSQEKISTLLTKIHEILYKYSHKKFHLFSKNKEFKLLFTYFEQQELAYITQDTHSEYAYGLEIIKGQL